MIRAAYAEDRAAGRTGEAFEEYRRGYCDQVAASWVLCTVFALSTMLCCALACIVPSRRALRIQPSEALRDES